MKLYVILVMGMFVLHVLSAPEPNFVPILTQTLTGPHVKIGSEEPKVFSKVIQDCGSFSREGDQMDPWASMDLVFLLEGDTLEAREIIFSDFTEYPKFGVDKITVWVFNNDNIELVGRYDGYGFGTPRVISVPQGRALLRYQNNQAGVSRFAFHFNKPGHCNMGSFSFPENQNGHDANEDQVFLIDPEVRGEYQITIPAYSTKIFHDFIRVFIWKNNQFELAGEYSGYNPSAPIPRFTAPQGRSLFSFTSGNYSTGTGRFRVVYYKV